jgi:hypothetical protein
MRRYIVIAYLVFLSVMVGLTLTLGVLVAPVVFHAHDLMALPITHYEEGLVMQEIFRRSTYIYMILAIAILIYEVYDFRQGRRDKFVMIAAFVVIYTIMLFVFYYTPEMIALQQAHQTQSEAFDALHKGSELDFKIMLFALVTLLLRRFTQLVRKK